ncbi:MAG: hypothetical protein A4E48_00255 [Methanosaeta sp. PtaU1.Bin060]|nr:MAG: hypothetical protein A4E48_00255 [Methanosaeta sp. PtaU1.Bin060]
MKIAIELEPNDGSIYSDLKDALLIALGYRHIEKVDPVCTPSTIQEHPEKSTRNEKKQRIPKIPHSEDALILQLRDEGKMFREIHEVLQVKGIVCNLADVCARHAAVRKAREGAGCSQPHVQENTVQRCAALHGQAESDNYPSTPAAETSTSEGQQGVKPAKAEPKSISRAELDQRIWEEWKDGLKPKEISDRLCAEGFYFGPGTIRSRLRAQGADL